MSRDWSWYDEFKNGDDDAFSRSLAEETDRSLAKDPGRWSWGPSVDDTVEPDSTVSPYRAGHGAHGRPGKGGTTERHAWRDTEYAKAKADLEQQRVAFERQQQRERDAAKRDLRDLARERRAEAARKLRDRVRDRDPGEGKGLFW